MKNILLITIFSSFFLGYQSVAQDAYRKSGQIERKFFHVLTQKLASQELTLTDQQNADIDHIIDNVLNEKIDENELSHNMVLDRIQENRKRAIELVRNVLLPHQMAEIEIRSVQLAVAEENYRKVLPGNLTISSPILRELLELNDSQIKQLEEFVPVITKKLFDMDQELSRAFQSIVSTVRTRIQRELNSQQLDRWESIVGEPYDFMSILSDLERKGETRRILAKLRQITPEIDGGNDQSESISLASLSHPFVSTGFNVKLIFDPQIQMELRLSQEQIEGIKRIKMIWEKGESDFFDRKEVARFFGGEEILPHQIERMKQLVIQAFRYEFILLSEIQIDEVQSAISPDHEQQETISRLLKESESELIEKHAEFRNKQDKAVKSANAKLFKILSPFQQQTYLDYFKNPLPDK